MKSKPRKAETYLSELLILPDGRVFVQNLTQPMANILRKLNPHDRQIVSRAGQGEQESGVKKSRTTARK